MIRYVVLRFMQLLVMILHPARPERKGVSYAKQEGRAELFFSQISLVNWDYKHPGILVIFLFHILLISIFERHKIDFYCPKL